jgi:flagellar secretion chaperone FliS
MPQIAPSLSAYTRVDVETSSQGKLIVMLFNGAIKRAEEAKRQMERGAYEGVHNNLIKAQDIIAELRGALNMQAGSISESLDRIYEYFQHLLIDANIRKDTAPIDECLTLMTQIRDAWQELFDQLAKEGQAPSSKPANNPHGASLLNLQG